MAQGRQLEMAQYDLGTTLLLQGKSEAALKPLEAAEEAFGDDGYLQLMAFLALHGAGRPADAMEYLTTYADTVGTNDWIVPVFQYFTGAINETELVAAAADEDSTEQAENNCEMYFYVGTAHLVGALGASPDTATAREYFEKCVAVGVNPFFETSYAQWYLDTLPE